MTITCPRLVYGESNSSFSVLITAVSTPPRLISLVEGQPQAGIVAATAYRYYSFLAPDLSYGLFFALTAYSGAPHFYLSADGSRPTAERNAGHSSGATPLRIPAQLGTRNSSFPFIIGVMGHGHPASYSLVARSGATAQLLQDGVAFVAELQPTDESWFKVQASAGSAGAPVLLVTPLQGTVISRLNLDGSRPSATTHDVEVTARPGHPASMPLGTGSVNVIQAVVSPPTRMIPPPPPPPLDGPTGGGHLEGGSCADALKDMVDVTMMPWRDDTPMTCGRLSAGNRRRTPRVPPYERALPPPSPQR